MTSIFPIGQVSSLCSSFIICLEGKEKKKLGNCDFAMQAVAMTPEKVSTQQDVSDSHMKRDPLLMSSKGMVAKEMSQSVHEKNQKN